MTDKRFISNEVWDVLGSICFIGVAVWMIFFGPTGRVELKDWDGNDVSVIHLADGGTNTLIAYHTKAGKLAVQRIRRHEDTDNIEYVSVTGSLTPKVLSDWSGTVIDYDHMFPAVNSFSKLAITYHTVQGTIQTVSFRIVDFNDGAVFEPEK